MYKRKQLLLLLSSAIVYALSFFFCDYVWWLVFVFPIPLFYGACTQDFSFKQGFIWGFAAFLLHLSGGIYVISGMAQQVWYVGLLIGLGMVIYQAFFAALVFWIAHSIITFCRVRSYMIIISIWILLLGLFFLWVDRYSLFVLDVWEGYCLMHPLLPLVKYPNLLRLLPVIGKIASTYLLLSVAGSITLSLLCKDKKAAFFLVITLMPWIVCWCMPVRKWDAPSWLSVVKSFPCITVCHGDQAASSLQFIGNECKKIITQWPQTQVIIMPESAISCDNLAECPQLLQLWDEQYFGKSLHIIFGAFRWRNGNYYNTLHWVYNGVLQDCCDKRHAMCLSERLSSGLRFFSMQNFYCTSSPEITVSLLERSPKKIGDLFTCIFYICSDLFFSEYPDDVYSEVPIVAIVNDSVFAKYYCSTYITTLLLLLARFKAIAWQRDIVYVSYAHSVFINKKGQQLFFNDGV